MEFDENSKQYRIFSFLHIKYAGILCGLIGILTTLAAFCLGMAYFPWSHYDIPFDVVALSGLVVFLVLSVAVHYMILHAIRFAKSRLLVPSLIYHAFLISLNTITALIAVGEVIAEQGSHHEFSHFLLRAVLILAPAVIFAEVLIIVVVVKLRIYLRNKRRHIRNGLPPPVCGVISPASVSVIHYYNKENIDRS